MSESCRYCGAPATQEHHISYDPEIKVPVCLRCHRLIHNHGTGYVPSYKGSTIKEKGRGVIDISLETKTRLTGLKVIDRESYNDVIRRLLAFGEGALLVQNDEIVAGRKSYDETV